MKVKLKKWMERVTYSTPVGMIVSFAGSTAPTGWLLCQGQAVSRTTYAKLFAVIGTTYGSGDGSTTFNVPDMRGRFPLGAGALQSNNQNYWGSDVTGFGGGAVTFPMGERGGETKHTLSVSQMPRHAHKVRYVGSRANGNYGGQPGTSQDATPNYNNLILDYEGGDGAHNNMPPYTVANAIIYVGG